MHPDTNRPDDHRFDDSERGPGRVSRRAFMGALGAAALAPRTLAQGTPPIPVTALNHVTISVSDPARSLEWYQGLFGMPIAARQANTVILRVGDGPQFLAIGGGASANPGIGHFCLSVDGFDADRLVGILGEHGIASSETSGPGEVRIRMRGAEFGGAPGGHPRAVLRRPRRHRRAAAGQHLLRRRGVLGDVCLETPEPAPTEGLLRLRDYNHFTVFVTDQARSIALYQRLFGLPIDTYQGALPVLRVGSGNQFLALGGGGAGPTGPTIHHACFTVDDFDVDRIMGVLEGYGVTPRGEGSGPAGPLQSYVTMRMPDRGGAPGGTPELYFTDPDGILLQLQDARYCGGNGYLGNECGTPENPTGRNA